MAPLRVIATLWIEPFDPCYYKHQEKYESEQFTRNRGYFKTPGADFKLSVWSVTF